MIIVKLFTLAVLPQKVKARKPGNEACRTQRSMLGPFRNTLILASNLSKIKAKRKRS
jgi:hypothetical protein